MMAHFKDLENKPILVTGANRGIGRAIALTLAKQHAHVICHFRPEREGFETLKQEIEANGGKASVVYFSLNNSAEIKSALDAYISANGPICGLVNNAGIAKDQLAMRTKIEDLDSIIDTNLKGTMMVTASLARNFMKAPNASIVNISSIVGLMGNSGQMAYAASKAGMIGFSKSIAKELSPRNIRSNVICPGFIETDMTADLNDEVKESYMSNIPLKRWGQADEVAELAAFLLSNSSSYITGEVIKIDGGLYI